MYTVRRSLLRKMALSELEMSNCQVGRSSTFGQIARVYSRKITVVHGTIVIEILFISHTYYRTR